MKKRIILTSLLTILCCASLISGATYSLFTSKSSHDISISAANVKITSIIDENSFKLFSLDGEVKGTTFPNGGKVYLLKDELVLENLTPGDSVSFNIHVTNESTIDIKYRGTVSLPGSVLQNYIEIDPAIWPGWILRRLSDPKEFDVPMKIGLKENAGKEAEGLNMKIPIGIQAIQANGTK